MRKKRNLAAMLMAATVVTITTGCQPREAQVGQLTQALPQEAWAGSKWISAADAPVLKQASDRAADGASWFVSTTKNEQKVTQAKWMTAGLGVFQLYLNGKPVGKEFLKPGFTHFGKTKRAFTYDLTEAFERAAGAENTLAAQVTPGWWADKIVTPGGYPGTYGTKVAFRGVLQLTYADGSTKLLGTNLDDWKAGIAGPVKHAAIFDGEAYDAREPMGYECSTLGKPEENNEFHGEILPTDGAEIYLRWDKVLSPVQAYVYKDIEGAREKEFGKVVVSREYQAGQVMALSQGETLVVDFGQNCAGVPCFSFKAAEGVTLTCLPAEILNDGNGAESRGMDGPEGSCHRTNLRAHQSSFRLDYTFAANNNAFVDYHPQCTFFGYRYVSLTATGDVQIRSIQSVPVTSIAQNLEIGKISTGNELVNKLISNTYWGQLSNYLSVSTDCPQRNERLGWTADTQVFAETGTFFAHTAGFFHKWMRDMRDSQSSLGGFPGVAPTAQYGNDMMRLGWADAGVIVPWTVWKQYADTRIVEENWEAMEKFMNHVNETKYNHQLLSAENHNYQWADWLSYEPLESCGGGSHENGQPRPEAIDYWNYLSTCYWLTDAAMMADMARATGREEAVAKYTAMADTARAIAKDTFMNPDGTFKTQILNSMQTPALFALRCKLVEGEAREKTILRLRQNFEQHDNCLQTGFLGTSILMATLTENGMADIAYKLLYQRKNPSWLYSIDNGATTIWERWNSYMKDKGMGPRGMNSFNHYAYGCVCEWLWETAAGIAACPATPGFKHIVMKPVPDKGLGHLTAEYQSAAGLIKSAWRYEGDKWIWDVTIPQGATATISLPDGETLDVAAGNHHFEK